MPISIEEDLLFSVTLTKEGVLSNEEILIRSCPKDFFKEDNPWVKFAQSLLDAGASLENWKWKRYNNWQKDQMINSLSAVLRSNSRHKTEIAGWILHCMLWEVPETLDLSKSRGGINSVKRPELPPAV